MAGTERYIFYLTSISVQNESKIGLAVVDNMMPKTDEMPETLVLTASIKPFINLVWGGTIVMVLGFFTSLVNRARLLKLESKRQERAALHTNGNGNGHRQNTHGKKEKHHTEKL
jgi:cytochrome c biogenesis factor